MVACLGSTASQQGSHVQGDFVAALIDGINQDLGKDVREISVYSLNSALDTAVRASSAQYDDPDTIARLQIRLEESVGTETGATSQSRHDVLDSSLAACLHGVQGAPCLPDKTVCGS